MTFRVSDVLGDNGGPPRNAEAIFAESRVRLMQRIREGIPELERVPGMAGAFVRGKRHHVAGELKSGKSLAIGVVATVDIVTAGGIVVVLDRENGADEYARRLEHVLNARGAPDQLRERIDEDFRYHAWPAVRLELKNDPGYPRVFEGADLVVFDSSRKFLSAVGLAEDSSDDYSAFCDALIDPLAREGIATVILDNIGHASGAKNRARGSSSKGDLADLVYVLKAADEFSLDRWGRVELLCVASRLGEIHGTWELEIGGGTYGRWCQQEHPEQRDRFLEACVTALKECSPLGRDALIRAARDYGAKGKSDVLRAWLREFAGEGKIASVDQGFTLTPQRGQGGVNPLSVTPDPPLGKGGGSGVTRGQGQGGSGYDAEGDSTAHLEAFDARLARAREEASG